MLIFFPNVINYKNRINCKLHLSGQWIRLYMLTIYIIHVECVDITMNHHLQLNVACNFMYSTNGFLIKCIDYKKIIIINYNYKLTFSLLVLVTSQNWQNKILWEVHCWYVKQTNHRIMVMPFKWHSKDNTYPSNILNWKHMVVSMVKLKWFFN